MNSAHRARLRVFRASSTTSAKCRIPHRRGFTSSAMKREDDLYRIMELGPEATQLQIRNRYFALSKLYHPDLNPNTKDAHEKFHRLQNAYAILGRPHERRDYDRKRAGIRTNTSQRTHAHSPGAEGAYPAGGSGVRAKRRTAAWTSTRQHPLEMGFAPRTTWHPEFKAFYDDWAAKMKEGGLDPEKTNLGYGGRTPNPALLQQMMNGDLLAQYMRKMRAQGKDPLSQIFMSATGRNSNAGQWLKNRMAMLDKEETARGGGVWERGGTKRRDAASKAWGPRPAYSSEHYSSPAEKLGGKGTGEETFNAPWDEPPRRGYQNEVPKPWWANAPGSQPAYDTWKSDASASTKRDYSRGHELDARHEEDKLNIVKRERRWRGAMVLVGATSAIIAGWSSLSTLF